MSPSFNPKTISNVLDNFNESVLGNSLATHDNFTYYNYIFKYSVIKNESIDYKSKIKFITDINECEIPMICNEFPNLLGLHEVASNPQCNLDDKKLNLIKSLIIDLEKPTSLKRYKNLTKVTFNHTFFNQQLDFLPESIEEICIDNLSFNQSIPNTFPNLKKLTIKSVSFDEVIDIALIHGLESLYIKSPTYSQINPNHLYDSHVKIDSLMFGVRETKLINKMLPLLHLVEHIDIN